MILTDTGPLVALSGRRAICSAQHHRRFRQFCVPKTAQEFDARANVGLGSYETVVADAAIGGGISDTVSVRLAGKWDYQAQGLL